MSFQDVPRDAATLPAPKGLARRTVLVHQNDAMQLKADWLVEEVPVELRYNGDAFAVMMMTPTDFEDFAYGFSLSEGRVESDTDIQAVTLHERLEGYVLEIDAPSFRSVGDDLERLLPGRSGCGLCGSRRLEEVLRAPPSVPVGPIVHPDALQRALNELQESQPLNRETGAVHAAAWARTNGDLLHVREDVGRHNALDKLLGALVREAIDMREGFVLVTSRASYEMVTKAARLGVGVLAAISAPTALAVALAKSSQLTLIGFLRRGRYVVYSHSQRLER